MSQSGRHKTKKSSSSTSLSELKVKCEYAGEKRLIQVSRPVKFEELYQKVRQYYGEDLNLHYTNGEIIVAVNCQSDLESAIQLLDRNTRSRSLRLFLTRKDEGAGGQGQTQVPPGRLGQLFEPVNQSTGPVKETSPKQVPERYSPPPGSFPPHDKHLKHSTSRTSVEGDGEFIPERDQIDYDVSSTEGSISGSRTSLDSSYISSHGDPFVVRGKTGDTFPFRGKSVSRRSIYSDTTYEEQVSRERENQKGGTYPRRYAMGTQMEIQEGRKTFPRARGRDFDNAFGEGYPIGTIPSEMSLNSNSSSSSGLVPDYDSPEGRRKRGSDYDLAVNGLSELSSAKSPRAPINWKKGKLLGAGAFGQVFLCYDADTGRELAVKQVNLGSMSVEVSKEVRALECEIQLLKNLHHERIVQYYGCHQDEKILSIFMEHMPGGSVKDQIRLYGPLTENVTRKYTRQILEGVTYLHHHMIVHRDIKGANILRDSIGNVKIGDFGASKRLQTICTQTGMKSVTGTPYWMSPEVINGDGYGRKADVWSIGCTVVEMLTSSPPWSEFEAMAAIFKIATADTPQYELPAHVSLVARDILELCFRKNQKDRPYAEELLKHRFVNEFT
ncbi:mitogen-activated protein kinase kinase kinase 3 isoform X2 [Lingula anatina]|nr:mitogen-activated protein kinase kinase kinase 3 isoform X2 [Lingula anatina]|eukprot:XP_013416446.1 mitogen-activated protein kinase kinase kinase 3 isoform X2 [Lingula anatina]